MKYAGREWIYQYRRLFDVCDEQRLGQVSNDVAALYSGLTRAWSPTKNSEWICRAYLATKMILNATVLHNSLEYARSAGLRAANPYFEYYATLSVLRAIVFTLPTQEWNAGALVSMSHAKTIAIAVDWTKKFNRVLATQYENLCKQLKAQRELIAYRAPASGDANLSSSYDLTGLLTTLAEVAQFNSELLEASITKNVDTSNFQFLDEHISEVSEVSIDGFSFHDKNDSHRLRYWKTKDARPYSLAVFITAGQAEDYLGAWDGDEENGEAFTNGSPANWQAIFDIP